MASRPFGSGSTNYGTLSGEGAGFNTSSRDVDFSRLKEIIGNAVISIKQNTQLLRTMERQVGTASDSNDMRNRIQSVIRATLHKVNTSKQQLGDLMQMARGTGDKGQQLAANSVQQTLTSAANDFQTVFQRVLEKLEQYREPPRVATPQTGYLDSGELEIEGDKAQLIRSAPPQQQQTQGFLVSTEASYLEERADRMVELESDITQLHSIMGEIGQMVVVQGENINTIEKHTEDAVGNVSEANQQLEQTVRLKRCSRKLKLVIACIVGGIALVVLIVVIIVIAVAVPKNNSKS